MEKGTWEENLDLILLSWLFSAAPVDSGFLVQRSGDHHPAAAEELDDGKPQPRLLRLPFLVRSRSTDEFTRVREASL